MVEGLTLPDFWHVREYMPEIDEDFIVYSWMRNHRRSRVGLVVCGGRPLEVPKDDERVERFWAASRTVVLTLLYEAERGLGPVIRVLSDREDMRTIYAWVCYEPGKALHFGSVKKRWQDEHGIPQLMVQALMGEEWANPSLVVTRDPVWARFAKIELPPTWKLDPHYLEHRWSAAARKLYGLSEPSEGRSRRSWGQSSTSSSSTSEDS